MADAQELREDLSADTNSHQESAENASIPIATNAQSAMTPALLPALPISRIVGPDLSGIPIAKFCRSSFTIDPTEAAELREQELARQVILGRLRPDRADPQRIRTYLDQDDSGDWEPKIGGKATKKTKSAKDSEDRARAAAERYERNLKKWDDIKFRCSNGGHFTCSSVVTLRLTSAKGKGVIGAIPDHWPECACLVRPLLRAVYQNNDISDKNIVASSLRPLLADSASAERPEVGLGDPRRHGCWGCFDKEECSLRNYNATSWPCEACIACEEECELILPPMRKLQCLRCKAKKLRCSYSDDPAAIGPCQNCKDNDEHCVAGPTKDGFPLRYICEAPGRGPRPKVWHQPDGEDENMRGNCSYCQSLDVGCSLGAEEGQIPIDHKPPCKNCSFENMACDGRPLIAKVARQITKKRQIVDDESSADEGAASVKESLPEKKLKPQPKTKGENVSSDSDSENVLFVSASLSEKSSTISDNDKAAKNGEKPTRNFDKPDPPQSIYIAEESRLLQPIIYHSSGKCSMCTSMKYAILGKKASSMVNTAEDLNENGTDLCSACTNSRVSILSCLQHEIMTYSLSTGAGTSFKSMIDDLLKDGIGNTELWCSLCPVMATHKCQRGVSAGGNEVGCGLLLCDICAKGLRRAKGDLGVFLKNTPTTRTTVRPLGLRADAELLRDDGELRHSIHGQYE